MESPEDKVLRAKLLMHYTSVVVTSTFKKAKRVVKEMDFTNRAGRPAQQNQQVVSPSHAAGGGHQGGKKGGKLSLPFNNIATALLLVSAAIVVLGLTWLLIFARDPNEEEFVSEPELQAVFLNGGQVYFGDITKINNDYIRLNNIYYLRVEQQVQPEQEGSTAAPKQDISLVKLGCELHGPRDQMVINRDQVLFWENLKSQGQVTEAVKKYVEANPKGQDCSQQQQQPSSNGSDASDDQDAAETNN